VVLAADPMSLSVQFQLNGNLERHLSALLTQRGVRRATEARGQNFSSASTTASSRNPQRSKYVCRLESPSCKEE
jgi:hypothetical protein